MTDMNKTEEDKIIEDSENNNELLINDDNEEENESNLAVGSFEEAPKFMQDNEYITTGYLLNCTTFKKTFKSLFMCHNETINIWTHIFGALFFLLLIFYTSIFITNYNSQKMKSKEIYHQ